jgi:hypothetical protein
LLFIFIAELLGDLFLELSMQIELDRLFITSLSSVHDVYMYVHELNVRSFRKVVQILMFSYHIIYVHMQ